MFLPEKRNARGGQMTDPLIQNIQQRILEAGYPTMEAFARQSGIRAETLTKWVQGKSRPSKKSLEKLAGVLGCSVEDFTTKVVQAAPGVDTDRTNERLERLERLVDLQERLIERLQQLLGRR
jgi:transcriptional regulator with XRE-family HTH domain